MNAPDIAGPSPEPSRRRRSMIGAVTLVSTCLLLTAACSSSKSGKGSTSAANSAPPSTAASSSAVVTSSAASSAPVTSQAGGDQITGTWNGTYASTKSSSRKGNFVVVFTQQGDTIAGTITIDGAPGGTINGKLSGHTITFGSIQPTKTTFDGSFSGNSMSGSYTSGPASGSDGGTWMATR